MTDAGRGLRMFVPGIPKPQGSMRAFRMGDRVQLVHTKHEDLAVWRGAVTTGALDVWGDAPALDEAVTVDITFVLPRPVSAPKRRVDPDRMPDVDKLARAVLDSLTGIVFTDDARVTRLHARKVYVDPTDHQRSTPGAAVAVWPHAPAHSGPGPHARDEGLSMRALTVVPSDAVGNHPDRGPGPVPPKADR